MPLSLRILMIVGALAVFGVIAHRIRKNKILMADATYWVVLGVLLVLAALFPGVIIWCAGHLGFISPSNFVFLCVIGLLLIKEFGNACEISLLKHKVNELVQEQALLERDIREDAGNDERAGAVRNTRAVPTTTDTLAGE